MQIWYVKYKHESYHRIFSMKKCYATIHVWLHDMDHNIDLNYRRKIRPLKCFGTDIYWHHEHSGTELEHYTNGNEMLTFWLRNFSALCCNVPTCQNIHIVKISPRITENEQWNIPNKCLVLLVSVVCNVQQHNYLHASNILSLSISTLQPETVFVVLSAKGSCDTVPQGFMPLFDLSCTADDHKHSLNLIKSFHRIILIFDAWFLLRLFVNKIGSNLGIIKGQTWQTLSKYLLSAKNL